MPSSILPSQPASSALPSIKPGSDTGIAADGSSSASSSTVLMVARAGGAAHSKELVLASAVAAAEHEQASRGAVDEGALSPQQPHQQHGSRRTSREMLQQPSLQLSSAASSSSSSPRSAGSSELSVFPTLRSSLAVSTDSPTARGLVGPSNSVLAASSSSSASSSPLSHDRRHFTSSNGLLPPRTPNHSSSQSASPLQMQRSLSPFSTPQQPATRSLLLQHRVLPATPQSKSAHSSPLSSLPGSPSGPTPPRLHSRRPSTALSPSAASHLAARLAVLHSSDLLFCVLDHVDFTQLFCLARVCRRWHGSLGGGSGSQVKHRQEGGAGHVRATSLLHSIDLGAAIAAAFRSAPSSPRQSHSSASSSAVSPSSQHSTATAPKRRSLVGSLLSRFACSQPASPTDDGRSNNSKGAPVRAADDSQLTSHSAAGTVKQAASIVRPTPRPQPNYFLRRDTAELHSLPLSKPQLALLMSRIAQVRHLRFSKRAERRLDGEFVSAVIETFGAASSATKLLSLSLCGCADAATDFGVSAERPLLVPSFLSAHAISHQKKKPVAISDSSFALLFCPTTSAACFSQLAALSLNNCHHLSESSFLLLNALPALRSLSLSHCLQLGDDTLESVVRHNPSLTSLNLAGCRSLTNACCYYLSSFLSSSLTALDLSGNGLINDAGLSHLATLTSLTSLCMRGVEFITDKGAVALSSCTRLTQLDLSDCPFVSGRTASFLALYMQLHVLELAGCALINDRAVHYIVSIKHDRRVMQRLSAQKDGKQHSSGEAAGEAVDDSGERDGRVEAAAQERIPGVLGPEELLDVLGLDEEDDSWMVPPSHATSAASSPARSSRTLQRPAPRNGGMTHSPSAASLRAPSLLPATLRPASSSSLLRHLSLSRCGELTDQAVRQLGRHATQLHSLDLSGCTQLSDASCAILAASLTQLRNLSLEGCIKLTNTATIPLANMRLHSLNLGSCTLMTDEAINGLCSHMALATSLRLLSLNDLPRLTDSGVHTLSTTFNGLLALNVSHCQALSDTFAFHVSIFMPQLSELACVAVEALSDDGWQRVMRMPRMTRVDVSHCRRLTGGAMVRMVRMAKSAAEAKRDEKAARQRVARLEKEKRRMIARGDLHEDDFDDDESGAASVGGGGGGEATEWSDALQLLVVRGCNRIGEDVIEQARKAYKRLKIVH